MNCLSYYHIQYDIEPEVDIKFQISLKKIDSLRCYLALEAFDMFFSTKRTQAGTMRRDHMFEHRQAGLHLIMTLK